MGATANARTTGAVAWSHGWIGAVGALLVASCSGAAGEGFGGGAGAGTRDAGGPVTSGAFSGAADADTCSGSEPGQGCTCSQAGQTVACWTGPADQRNVGSCHDGTRHCIQHGEISLWGPCGGQQVVCTLGTADAGSMGASSGSSSGGGSSGSSSGGSTCTPASPQCLPGAIRYCDDGSCYWGTQSCGSDGRWGECDDTPGNQGPPGCNNINYDENCCVDSGSCCAHAVGGDNGGSVGRCGGAAPCDSCPTVCVPGGVRWCSVPSSGPFSSQDEGPWGKQTCGSSGTWSACAASSTAPPGCTTTTTFDSTCCQASGQCCEVFDDEDADPVSVNCPLPACTPRAPDGSSGGG
jgi:hypothetical protein